MKIYGLEEEKERIYSNNTSEKRQASLWVPTFTVSSHIPKTQQRDSRVQADKEKGNRQFSLCSRLIFFKES